MNTMTSRAVREKYGVPTTGSPMHAAVIGARDLAASVAFYRDRMGFDLVDVTSLSGSDFTTHWGLPPGSCARMAVLADRGCEVGRIALVQFDASKREPVRTVEGQRFFGLVNLNFYTNDIIPHTERLSAAGCRPWSPPVVHEMGPVIGQPIEVMIDGPDTVIFNLIELQAREPDARILRTRAYIDDTGGFNRCGGTPVVTSQHCVRDYEAAMRFHVDVLEMSVRNDTVLAGDDMELFMQYPKGARTRDTYLQGDHVYGKIAVNHPLNFECVDITPRAVAPNIGYLAQTFVVKSLEAALERTERVRAESFSAPVEFDYPGLGRVAAVMVRHPGSGALQELVERL